jgi:hypothetical protein
MVLWYNVINNMKKAVIITIILLLLVVTVLGAPLAFASDFGEGIISPDSPLNSIQNFGEEERLILTFNKESKVDYLLKLSDRRVKELQDEPNRDVTKRYQQHFVKLQELAGQIDNKEVVADKIREMNLAQQQTLANVYQKVPQSAQAGILTAQQNSAKSVAAVIEKVEGQDAAKEFMAQAQQIQQVQIQQKIQPVQMLPQEGDGPAADPNQTQYKELNPLRPEMPSKDLDQLRPEMETGGDQGENRPVAPVVPAPMQPQN